MFLPKNNLISSIYRYIRRYYLIFFRKKYVEESIKNRKGHCKKCGCCGSISCKYFIKSSNHCLKYPNYPLICKLYPIDEKDKNEFSKIHCGFYWKNIPKTI